MTPLFTNTPTLTLERNPSSGYILQLNPSHVYPLYRMRIDLDEEQYKELKKQMALLDGIPQLAPNYDRSYYDHPTIPNLQAYQVAQAFSYNVGVAMTCLWRAGRKPGNDAIDDLEKCIDHVQYEIDRLKRQRKPLTQTFNELRSEFGQGWQDDNAD